MAATVQPTSAPTPSASHDLQRLEELKRSRDSFHSVLLLSEAIQSEPTLEHSQTIPSMLEQALQGTLHLNKELEVLDSERERLLGEAETLRQSQLHVGSGALEEVRQAVAERDAARKDAELARTEYEKLKVRVQETEALLKGGPAELEAITAAREEARRDADAARAECDELKADAELEAQLAHLQEDVAQARSSCADWKTRVERANAECASAEAEADRLRKLVAAAEEEARQRDAAATTSTEASPDVALARSQAAEWQARAEEEGDRARKLAAAATDADRRDDERQRSVEAAKKDLAQAQQDAKAAVAAATAERDKWRELAEEEGSRARQLAETVANLEREKELTATTCEAPQRTASSPKSLQRRRDCPLGPGSRKPSRPLQKSGSSGKIGSPAKACLSGESPSQEVLRDMLKVGLFSGPTSLDGDGGGNHVTNRVPTPEDDAAESMRQSAIAEILQGLAGGNAAAPRGGAAGGGAARGGDASGDGDAWGRETAVREVLLGLRRNSAPAVA